LHIEIYAAFNATQQMGQRPRKVVQLFLAHDGFQGLKIDQYLNQGMEQGFSSLSGIMNKLKES
jgi:hypothetical protein